jgi:hypothetical protein
MLICDEYIKKIANEQNIEFNKETLERTKKLFQIIINFIEKKKFILYGGYALNAIVQKKFYNKLTDMNDFDIYTDNIKKITIDLSNILIKHGYKYVEVRTAKPTSTTYKLYVEFINVCDFTYLSKEKIKYIQQIIDADKKISNVTNNFQIAPVIWLKHLLTLELASPKTSYFRFDKLYKRFNILFKEYPEKNITIENVVLDKNINLVSTEILKYVKHQELPLIGNIALNLYTKNDINHIISHENAVIEILAIDVDKVVAELMEKYKLYKMNKKGLFEGAVSLYIYNEGKKKIVVDIHNVESQCLSIIKLNGYNVGTLFTIISYLYLAYFKNYFHYNDDIKYQIYNAFKIMKKTKCNRLLNLNCYGQFNSLRVILKQKWETKQTIYRPEHISQAKSIFSN